MDHDQQHLKKCDLWTVESTEYILVKNYLLKMKGEAPYVQVFSETLDLSKDGFEVRSLENGRLMVTKSQPLNSLEAAAEVLNKASPSEVAAATLGPEAGVMLGENS